MTPVFQSIQGTGGDCFRSCIASVLDLPREDVPHFYEAALARGDKIVSEGDQAAIRAWFRARGEFLIEIGYHGGDPGELMRTMAHQHPSLHYILTGQSFRGLDHAVVCRDDAIVHDPSGSVRGLFGPQRNGYYYVCFIGRLV